MSSENDTADDGGTVSIDDEPIYVHSGEGKAHFAHVDANDIDPDAEKVDGTITIHCSFELDGARRLDSPAQAVEILPDLCGHCSRGWDEAVTRLQEFAADAENNLADDEDEEAGADAVDLENLSRPDLDELDYQELRGLAATFDDINGNQSRPDLIVALREKIEE